MEVRDRNSTLKRYDPTHYSRGFTFVELLVVVLIIAILMTVALPMYLSATASSQRNACRANLQLIANAEWSYKIKNSSHAYVAVTTAQSLTGQGLTDLQSDPKCPLGGKYSVILSGTTNDSRSVPSGGLAVQCNFATNSHGSFIPGADGK